MNRIIPGCGTDTAAYVDDVAECTNVSVGYEGAHGKTEKLNVDYLFKLRDAMCKIDVTKFVATVSRVKTPTSIRGHTIFTVMSLVMVIQRHYLA
jgi:hypothetical protein